MPNPRKGCVFKLGTSICFGDSYLMVPVPQFYVFSLFRKMVESVITAIADTALDQATHGGIHVIHAS